MSPAARCFQVADPISGQLNDVPGVRRRSRPPEAKVHHNPSEAADSRSIHAAQPIDAVVNSRIGSR